MPFMLKISIIFNFFLISGSIILGIGLKILLDKNIRLSNLLFYSSIINEIKSPIKRSLRKVSLCFHYEFKAINL